ncbi:hypothetical protein [Paenibacillus piri]|uniref:Uncharacterized protein n=1 Tax=Paenibacillus piri TaxID=2547395 RepID=A0A4R5KNE8_9BACL|nr:hypothetical protein [Paenibacillus piri]TDF96772.1 hypothetical protein E1757_16990 [Paenibacillus piri]
MNIPYNGHDSSDFKRFSGRVETGLPPLVHSTWIVGIDHRTEPDAAGICVIYRGYSYRKIRSRPPGSSRCDLQARAKLGQGRWSYPA